MTPEDRPAFARELARLYAVYERTVTSEQADLLAEAYWEALEGYELGELRAAVRWWIRTSPYFPRPAELIDVIRQARRAERLAEAARARRPLPAAAETEAERREAELARARFAALVASVAERFAGRNGLELPPVTLEELGRHRARARAVADAFLRRQDPRPERDGAPGAR